MGRPSIDELRGLLAYDAATGILTWRVRVANRVQVGDVVGHIDQRGYRTFKLGGKYAAAHRVIWALVHGEWPPDGVDIDHVNGDRADNRLVNLRLATRLENCANRKTSKRNTTGHTGLVARRGGFEVYLGRGWSKQYIGFFKSWANAVQARLLASAIERGAFHPEGVHNRG